MNETWDDWDEETRENWDYKMSVPLKPEPLSKEECEEINRNTAFVSSAIIEQLKKQGKI